VFNYGLSNAKYWDFHQLWAMKNDSIGPNSLIGQTLHAMPMKLSLQNKTKNRFNHSATKYKV